MLHAALPCISTSFISYYLAYGRRLSCGVVLGEHDVLRFVWLSSCPTELAGWCAVGSDAGTMAIAYI